MVKRTQKKQKAGGFTHNLAQPVGGQMERVGYSECCPPVYNNNQMVMESSGQPMCGGSKKTSKKRSRSSVRSRSRSSAKDCNCRSQCSGRCHCKVCNKHFKKHIKGCNCTSCTKRKPGKGRSVHRCTCKGCQKHRTNHGSTCQCHKCK